MCRERDGKEMLNWEKIRSWCINIYFGFIPKVEPFLRSQVNVSGCRQIIDLLAGPETWGHNRQSLLLMLQISKWCQPPLENIRFFGVFFFLVVWCLFVAQACDWQERYMLLESISAAVSKKSQQRLAFGCQLKEDTNYWYSARIWKLRCGCSAAWRTDNSVFPFPTVVSGVSAKLFQSWPNSCAGHVG